MFPAHQLIGNHEISAINMFLAQATAKHKPPSSCTIKTQTPAQKRLPKEKYELQNEKELSVAIWFGKNSE